jgi:hypothetical protein
VLREWYIKDLVPRIEVRHLHPQKLFDFSKTSLWLIYVPFCWLLLENEIKKRLMFRFRDCKIQIQMILKVALSFGVWAMDVHFQKSCAKAMDALPKPNFTSCTAFLTHQMQTP